MLMLLLDCNQVQPINPYNVSYVYSIMYSTNQIKCLNICWKHVQIIHRKHPNSDEWQQAKVVPSNISQTVTCLIWNHTVPNVGYPNQRVVPCLHVYLHVIPNRLATYFSNGICWTSTIKRLAINWLWLSQFNYGLQWFMYCLNVYLLMLHLKTSYQKNYLRRLHLKVNHLQTRFNLNQWQLTRVLQVSSKERLIWQVRNLVKGSAQNKSALGSWRQKWAHIWTHFRSSAAITCVTWSVETAWWSKVRISNMYTYLISMSCQKSIC